MTMAMTRTRSLVGGWALFLVLFLGTLMLKLVVTHRDIEQQGLSGFENLTDVLFILSGGLLLLIPLYGVFARLVGRRKARQSDGHALVETVGGEGDQTAVVINAFHDVVRKLRDKEQELERLRSIAEARAQEIESYNENILRSVASGVITFNQDSTVTTFNEAASRILRMKRDAVIGKICAEIFGPSSKITALLERSHQRGEIINREEFELEEPEGHRIWVGVSTSFLKDRADKLIGTTFVFTDLTEVKELQQQIELRERMTVLGEMSAGIAHEFRNFMGTILGAAKLIARQLKPQEPAQESVGTIVSVIADMDHLITQFLNFSKKTELELKPVAIEAWLTRVVEQVRAQAEDRSYSVEIICPPNLPEIAMDELLMRQALGNLVQNALEAMPKGGKLTVMASLPWHGSRRELELRIRDTGIGIPGDRLEKVFLPFYTTKTKGTGLGLALVHKIVLLHNGRIQVESQEGQGTIFRVYVPIEERA